MPSMINLSELDLSEALAKLDRVDVSDALARLSDLEVVDALADFADHASESISRVVESASEIVPPPARLVGRSPGPVRRNRTKLIITLIAVAGVAGAIVLWRRRTPEEPSTEPT